MIANIEKYISLGTLKRDASFVDTAVWFVQESSSKDYLVLVNINSGKVKRIRNFSDARVAVCDWKGGLLGGWHDAGAELIEEPEMLLKLFRKKYGLQFRVFEFFSWLSRKHKERQIIRVVLKT